MRSTTLHQAAVEDARERRTLRTMATASLLLCVIGALAWVLALRETLRPGPPEVQVRADAVAPGGAPLPVLVSARDENSRRWRPLQGTLQVASGPPLALEEGLARVRLPTRPGPYAFVLAARWGDEDIELAFEIVVSDAPPPLHIPRAWSWQRALLAPSGADRSKRPVFLESGLARSALGARAWSLTSVGPTLTQIAPHAVAMHLVDGRRLTLDRSGVWVELPAFARAGERLSFTVWSAHEEECLLAFVAGGRLFDLRPLTLRAGANEVTWVLPADLAAGELFEVQVSSSRHHPRAASVSRGLVLATKASVRAAADPAQEARATLVASRIVFPEGDPLWDYVQASPLPLEHGLWRALLARVETPDAFPGRIGPGAARQRERANERRAQVLRRYRGAFRGLGVLVAVLVAVLAARLGRRRIELEHALADETHRSGRLRGRALSSRGHLRVLAAFGVAAGLWWVLDLALAISLRMSGGER